ncbi:FadR family transcriptional regulator [Alginatibacterium sediminis]|uniref:FadR family transcriptional regulator n=1 Tax=Alginatibacterium sediminis TaxID=2164068 RepID=A0A420EB68_9ALTE|nr:GntR family transcriptional regulator [Alginatibacterium sediminis]RKF17937.1 FadR family transcriptional regulator [Alginatibacterium sediminis]
MTATEEIIEYLGDQIVSGKYKPLEKLPTERDLAIQLGVARGRVREALRGLSMAGLIEIKRGNGTFVKPSSEWMNSTTVKWAFCGQSASMEELFAVRDVLEKGVYNLAFDNCSNADLLIIEKDLSLISEHIKSDLSTYADCLDRFDLQLAKVARNVMFLSLFQALIILRRRNVEAILALKGSREQSLQLRKSIYTSFKNRDKKQALDAIDNFFDKAQQFVTDE